jgi:hypothetical protein
MKKKLLSFSSVALGCALAFTALKSDSNGKLGLSTSGCSCHGVKNTSTTANITGLPTTLTPGASYTIAVTVGSSTFTKAGFDLAATAGDFTATNATAYKLNTAKTEVAHKAPGTMSSGLATFSNIIFKAPASAGGSVTFNVAGNGCNGDGGTNGDGWNLFTVTVPVDFPASVSNINTKAIASCLPNVVTNQTTITANGISSLQVVSLQGQVMFNEKVSGGNSFNLDCSKFATGTYIVRGSSVDGFFTTKFSKQ